MLVVSALLIDDKNSKVRVSTARALVRLGTNTTKVLNCWLSLLHREDWLIRSAAAESLAHLSKTSDTILPQVVQWLEQNRDADVMGGAIDCLFMVDRG
jgi:HEAT repeat protein